MVLRRPNRLLSLAAVAAALLAGCAAGPHLDRGLWEKTVQDYLRLRGTGKALVLDLDSYQSYSVWNDDEATEQALSNCRAAGHTACALVYRGNRSVLDVTPHYQARAGKLDFAAIAQTANAMQAGLSGRPIPMPTPSRPTATAEAAGGQPDPQTCQPVPPSCAAAGEDAKRYVVAASARLRDAGVPTAAMAGMQAYCVNRRQAQVARICADEYGQAGLQSCAALARRQMDENLRVAGSARATAGSYATEPVERACGW